MRRIWIGLAIGSLLTVIVVPVAFGAADDADLALSPSTAQAGASVQAVGSGFSNAGLDVEIRWDDWTGPLLATAVTADSNGVIGFATNITIPGGATPGTHDVVACVVGFVDCDAVTEEFHEGATTSFTVESPPTTTTTTVATTVTTGTTVPNQELPLPGIGLFPGPVAAGLFGPYQSPVDGIDLELFIPRCAPPGGATILDFDTDWVGYRPSTTSFPAVDVIDQIVEVAPAGSITPRNAVHLWRSTGVHRVAQFAIPQRYIGLYIGDYAETEMPITLVGYNSAFEVVAADRIASANAPADTCMMAQSDAEDIVLAAVLIGGSADPYADRFFFGTDAVDFTPLQTHGTVEFLRPLDRDEVSTRTGQVVLGTIRVPEEFPIEEVILSVPWWDHTRIDHRPIDFMPLWTEDGDQLYTFFANRVYVPQGASWMSITATGPGVVATGGIEVVGVGRPPLHAEDLTGRVDVDPVTIEVTQAVRGIIDMIPPGTSIADRDDAVLVQNKKTVVRGFARLQFPDGFTFTGTTPVNAELVGTRNGMALPGSPLTPVQPTILLRVQSDRADSYHFNKQQTELSWNFVLPDSWTDPGTIDLRLEVNSPALAGHIDEHPDFDGELNVIGLDDVEFRSKNAPAVNIWLVDYYFKCTGLDDMGNRIQRDGQGSSPTSAESFCVGLPEGETVHAQPSPWAVATAVVESWNMAPFPGPAPTQLDLWEYTYATDGVRDDELEPGPLLTPGSPQERFWLGVAFKMDLIVGSDGYNSLNALMSSFVRGKAWGSPSFFRITPTPTTFIHEAGHTMGLRHTGSGHRESGWIARWDGDHGEIDQSLELVSAFDTLRMQALPYAGLHDFMSYGGPRWVSPALWDHVEDAVGSGFARVDNRVDDDGWRLFWEIWPFDGQPAEGAPPDNEIVIASGQVTPDGVELITGFSRPNGAILDAEGDVLLRVLGADGAILSESPTLSFESSDDDTAGVGFVAPLRVPPGSTELVVLVRGVEVDRIPMAPAPTGVTQPIPASGGSEPEVLEVGRDPMDLTWSVGDGAVERYLVEITRDGREWFSIAVTDQPSATIDPTLLPFQGPGWRMRVQASTGLSVAISPEIAVEFAARPTTPMILLPIDGSVISSNTLIQLQAAVSSFSIGAEDRYLWTVDGTRVAMGSSGLTFAGDPGTHTVALRDPETGLEATSTITVVVDSDLDGMSDEWEAEWGLDPEDPADAGTDTDGDGVVAADEFRHGSSPESIDTDGDAYADDLEIAIGTDPNDPDSYPGVGFDGQPAPRIDAGATVDIPPDDDGGGANLLIVILGAGLAGAVLAGGFTWLKGRR